MENTQKETININFQNEVQIANVWIIPNIAENRNTFLWGYATVEKSALDRNYRIPIIKSSNDEYLLYMIDIDEMYYESGPIILYADYKITVTKKKFKVKVSILNASGKKIFEKEIFNAAL